MVLIQSIVSSSRRTASLMPHLPTHMASWYNMLAKSAIPDERGRLARKVKLNVHVVQEDGGIHLEVVLQPSEVAQWPQFPVSNSLVTTRRGLGSSFSCRPVEKLFRRNVSLVVKEPRWGDSEESSAGGRKSFFSRWMQREDEEIDEKSHPSKIARCDSV